MLAAVQATSSAADEELTCLLRAPEPGVVDLDRLVVHAIQPAARADQYAQIDLSDRLVIERVRVRNTEDLIRGGENALAPGGVFAAARQYSPVALGRYALDGNDFVEVTARLLQGAEEAGWILTAVAPFQPRRLAGNAPWLCDPGSAHSYLGSDPAELPAPTVGPDATFPTTLRLRADEPGILDLDSLQVAASLQSYEANYASFSLPSVVVRAITLPSGEQLVVGAPRSSSGSFAVPGPLFGHVGRTGSWVRLGQVALSEEDAVEVVLERMTSAFTPEVSITAVVGARFYPSAPSDAGGFAARGR